MPAPLSAPAQRRRARARLHGAPDPPGLDPARAAGAGGGCRTSRPASPEDVPCLSLLGGQRRRRRRREASDALDEKTKTSPGTTTGPASRAGTAACWPRRRGATAVLAGEAPRAAKRRPRRVFRRERVVAAVPRGGVVRAPAAKPPPDVPGGPVPRGDASVRVARERGGAEGDAPRELVAREAERVRGCTGPIRRRGGGGGGRARRAGPGEVRAGYRYDSRARRCLRVRRPRPGVARADAPRAARARAAAVSRARRRGTAPSPPTSPTPTRRSGPSTSERFDRAGVSRSDRIRVAREVARGSFRCDGIDIA